MAPTQPPSKSKPSHTKLPKLPPNTKISKRTLPRPPPPPTSSSSQQIIYLSSSTPFMSAITRLRKSITAIQKRRSQSIHASAAKTKGKGKDKILAAAIESLDRQDKNISGAGQMEEVIVQGTGKAVEKVLAVAGWLKEREEKEGVRVRLQTRSWWAVDDVVVDPEGDGEGEGEEIPDSRMRRLSILEVRVGVL